MKRVVVTTLHEDEQSLAQSILRVLEQGEGLVVGDVDDEGLERLRDAGLLVEEVHRPESLRRSGFIVSSTLEVYSGGLPKAPAEVELAANGPILSEWVQHLQDMGVTRIERAGGDRLSAHVDDEATLTHIAALDWVIGVRDAQPARAPVAFAAPGRPINGPALPQDTRDPAWDVRVRDAVEAKQVEAWATQNGVEIVGSGTRRVRLRVPAGKEAILDALGLPVAPFVPPVLHNDCARLGVGIPADARARVGAVDVTLTGRDQIIGVADTGIDDAHPDFAGRIAGKIARGRPADTTDPQGHGTHVSGTILGSGSASGGKYRGVAPEARLVFQSIFDAFGRLGGLPVDLGDLFAEAHAAGVRIHNNSWGSAVQSRYTGESEDVDAFVAAHPEMLVVISAGNEGTTVVDPDLPSHLEPGRVQPLSLGAPATSKNALVVGASRSSRAGGGLAQVTYQAAFAPSFPLTGKPADVAGEQVSGDVEQLAAFSSRGPCDDRRIKPDVVAPGTDILSTRSSIAPDDHFWGSLPAEPYAYMGGTSMSAPVVTGFAALVREYYVRHRGVAEPSAALLKATLINGTRVLTGADAGGPVPNPHQGFGLVHLPTTLPSSDGIKLAFTDVPAASGFARVLDRRRFTFDVAAKGEVRICLAFTDPPARGLQNDLDLVVELPGLSRPKILGNKDLRGRLTQEDSENNVEIVRVSDAPPGRWTVAVVCRNLLREPQGFALVVLGPLGDEVLQSG
jgi:serine protease AprX